MAAIYGVAGIEVKQWSRNIVPRAAYSQVGGVGYFTRFLQRRAGVVEGPGRLSEILDLGLAGRIFGLEGAVTQWRGVP